MTSQARANLNTEFSALSMARLQAFEKECELFQKRLRQ